VHNLANPIQVLKQAPRPMSRNMKVHMPLLERAHSRESCGLQFESRPVLFRALKSQGEN
jgi:hypothetical protein